MTNFDFTIQHYGIDLKSMPYLQQEPIRNLVERLLEVQKQIEEIEESHVPMYCPTCTSCGNEGCCSPDACVAVKCLYEENNLKSYREAQDENTMLWDFLESCKGTTEWASQAAYDTEEKIKQMWSKNYPNI